MYGVLFFYVSNPSGFFFWFFFLVFFLTKYLIYLKGIKFAYFMEIS